MAGTCAFKVLVLASGGALLAGCQAIEKSEAGNTERLLAAAGFEMQEATSPEQLANLEQLSQHTLLRHEQDGHARYVYADAKDCKCVYIGDQENYDEFQKLAAEQEIAEENVDASLQSDMWDY